MITIRLLGGARKALDGKSSIEFDKSDVTISQILDHLHDLATDSLLLNPENLIVAVNGVDSAALDGKNTRAKHGDIVTVVTVVHGGATLEDGTSVAIVGVKKIIDRDVGGYLDRLRRAHERMHMQALRAESVFGVEHVLGALRIALEARRRGIMIANKIEAELLLRLACTNQISVALSRVGLKQAMPACIIAFSDVHSEVEEFAGSVKDSIVLDEFVLQRTLAKKRLLGPRVGIPYTTRNDEFLKHLVEIAAVLTK
jgi:tRNA threonylcarbamoyladenosine modification (KEOPS) complex Cgi121 subunit/molybdopterin converting factor small subunit